MKATITAAFAIGLALAATPVLAASDYLLTLDGVPGESSSSIQIESFSWGVSQQGASSTVGSGGAVAAPRDAASGLPTGRRTAEAPRDAASGLATGKRTHKPIRMTSSSDASAGTGGARVAAGDVTGDGRSDLAHLVTQDEIQGFSLSFDKASPVLAKLCSGAPPTGGQLSGRGETYTLENAAFSCPAPKQTQGATFGERCSAGVCPAGALITVVVTGQLKHTKSGHVTLLK